MTDASPRPFFDLAACIEAAEKAAISARALAHDYPEQAVRHLSRSEWYLERARQWAEELERADA